MDFNVCHGTIAFVLLCFLANIVKGAYHLAPVNKTWLQANQYCMARQETLYVITHVSQWTALKDEVPISIDSQFWIGLYRDEDESFKWVDGTTFDVDMWLVGEPNNDTARDCVKARSNDSRWFMANCAEVSEFVCQTDERIMVPSNTPKYRAPPKRDDVAVMVEGLLKGFACAGGMILVVVIIFYLPCCRNFVTRKSSEMEKWHHLQRQNMSKNEEPVQTIRPEHF